MLTLNKRKCLDAKCVHPAVCGISHQCFNQFFFVCLYKNGCIRKQISGSDFPKERTGSVKNMRKLAPPCQSLRVCLMLSKLKKDFHPIILFYVFPPWHHMDAVRDHGVQQEHEAAYRCQRFPPRHCSGSWLSDWQSPPFTVTALPWCRGANEELEMQVLSMFYCLRPGWDGWVMSTQEDTEWSCPMLTRNMLARVSKQDQGWIHYRLFFKEHMSSATIDVIFLN